MSKKPMTTKAEAEKAVKDIPRVRQSGEASWSAGIGHAPDKMMRSYLYQAATVVLTIPPVGPL